MSTDSPLPPIGADGRWRSLLVLVANGLGQAAGAVGAAFAVERAFGLLGAPNRTGLQIVGVMGMLVAAGALGAWLRGRERSDGERLGQRYTHVVRLELFDRLVAMAPRAVQGRSQGATALRFIGDLNAVRRWVSLGLSRLLVAGTMTVGTLLGLAVLAPVLAAVTAAVVAGGVAASVLEGRSLRHADREARRRRARLAGNVNEKIGAIGVVQVHGATVRERRRMARQSRRLRQAMIERARHLGRLQAMSEATGAAATGTIVVAGLVAGVPAPTVAAAATVVGLLVPQLRDLGRVQEYWHGHRVAVDAIGRFYDRPTLLTEHPDPTPLPDGPGHLAFCGAGWGEALHAVTAVADAGRVVAVVGGNGAGKSTLVALAARLMDPDRGSIELDGHDLSTVSLHDARRAIGIVSPDLPLLRGSLERNIRYRWPDAPDDALADVVTQCGLDPVVADLPDGMETRVTEGGVNLSAGQRQRVLLARALLGRPRLLLLDEADANLDPATTSIIDDVVATHTGTTLIVTHRAERLDGADEIWHLDHGHLVEQGGSADLLDSPSRTSRLFGVQRAG